MERTQRKPGGLSAFALILPIAAILAVLHLVIISLILQINQTSEALSNTMRLSARYTQEATGLLAGSSLLSETSSNYVLMPVNEAGEPNVGPLMAYAQELRAGRGGQDVLEKFRGYGLAPELLSRMETAAAAADAMRESQFRALELTRTAYPLPPLPALDVIPRVALTQEEQAMSAGEKTAAARELLLNMAYGENKAAVSQNVNGFVDALRADSAQQQASFAARIGQLRAGLWVSTLVVVAIFLFTFVLLLLRMLQPLRRFVGLLPKDKPLDETHGFREVRMVAAAYNDVLHRRNALDAILRSAAETDTLTGLPNRYSFERYLLDQEDSGEPAAMLAFDIDYLKQTNDTKGHGAGDHLICAAAECISACFGDEKTDNCFRIGGDEFAAVVCPGTPATVQPMIKRFNAMQAQKKISVSCGCAYVPQLHREEIQALLAEADRQMYARKKQVHRIA